MSDPPQPIMAPLTTFHPFPKLPWELRNEIWKHSIRPLDRPGAHVFYVEERDLEDSEPYECDVVSGHIQLKDHPLEPAITYLSVAVPAKTISSGPAVMERTFNHQKWDPIRKAYPQYKKLMLANIGYDDMWMYSSPPPGSDDSSNDDTSPPSPPLPQRPNSCPATVLTPHDPYRGERSLDMVPATGYFWSSPSSPPPMPSNEQGKAGQSGGQFRAFPYYFSVFPHQDLMIFRPPSWAPEISGAYWHWLKEGFPFGIWRYSLEGWTMRDGAVGVFDNLKEAVTVFSDDGPVSTIWLIDYRLRLNNETPEAIRDVERHQKVWYGGDGCRFVEIYPELVLDGGDYLQWYRTEGIDGEDSAKAPGSCHSFIQVFERSMLRYSDDQ
ncbi:hypothetical protein QBC45DRAFT_449985 [Copromyces sp. CBS 386.78]|nr:hypothetical protein QBC45DRAFT_449985 [Copromyces sp. CBS 386.78]